MPPGPSSQQELDQAQANYDAALAQLSSSKARLQQERVTLKYLRGAMRPAAGTVGDVPIRVGMHVTSDTVLTTIDLNQALEVYVPVPLDRSRDLKLGLPVQVLDGQGTLLATTQVTFISPRVDDQTQSILVKAPARRRRGAALLADRPSADRLAEGRGAGDPGACPSCGSTASRSCSWRRSRTAAWWRASAGSTWRRSWTTTSSSRAGSRSGERIVVSGVQKLDNGVPIRTS